MSEPQHGTSDQESHQDGQWTEPQLRFMKRAIAVMSTILILGFMLLIWRIMNLTTAPETPKPAPIAGAAQLRPNPAAANLSFKALATLALPAGARIERFSLSGRHLAVQYSAQGGGGIAILDLTTGAIVSRVQITEQTP